MPNNAHIYKVKTSPQLDIAMGVTFMSAYIPMGFLYFPFHVL